ncbi:MAG: hypothetical protein H7Y38_14650 [Armatimonadetes bacterium]|nr:hypothetical protein [Armatimonadota bacterium]
MTLAKGTAAARLLILPFLLGMIWAFATPPPINGTPTGAQWGNFHPDEGSHVSVVMYMASHAFALPPYVPPYDTGVHPPLYHELAALLFAAARAVLSAENALRVVRLLSVFAGLGTVWFAYRAARQTRFARAVALPAALLIALIPMRLSLSGAITNENFAALGATATLALLYENIRFGFRGRRFAALVFWCAVAIGSKITALGLVVAIGAGMLYVRSWRGEPLRLPALRFAALLVSIGASLGWWFVYNTVNYGDPLRKAAADRLWDAVQPGYAVLGVRNGFAPWRYMVALLHQSGRSFWGVFDGFSHPFPPVVYAVLFAAQLAALIGAASGLPRILLRSRTERAIGVTTGIFAAWVFLVFVQYNWAHYTPQGRYFFVLLAPFGILMAGGMNALLRRIAAPPATRQIVWYAIGAFLLLLNLYAVTVMPRRLP